MAQKLEGQYSLREMIRLTYQFKLNRFEYMKRDVVKRIIVIKRTILNPDRPAQPTIRYEFITRSWPQYTPYNKHTAKGSKQRKTKHEYDAILTLQADEHGRMSMDSTMWKYRLGSQMRWQTNVPQKLVKTIYRETAKKWTDQYNTECKKIKSKYSDKKIRDKKLLEAKKAYNKKFTDQKKNGKYLDVGDYNSQVRGINGDFAFRVAPVLQYWGHLYGKDVEKADGDTGKPFLPKHALRLINELIKLNILT